MGKKVENQEISSCQRVYNYLVEYITDNCYVPSIQEIAEGTCLGSKSSVHECLQMLELMGKIQIQKKTPRAIKIVGYQFVKVE